MSTAQEIENAIRSLSSVERHKLIQSLPRLFPEFDGDSQWERIAQDDRPRPALIELLNLYETEHDIEQGRLATNEQMKTRLGEWTAS